MTAAPLLYRSTQQWRIWLALAGAALLHVAAIAIADGLPKNAASAPITDMMADVEFMPTADEPLSNNSVEEPAMSLPEPSALKEPSSTIDEHPVRPARQITARAKRLTPLVTRAIGENRATSLRVAKVLAVSAPRLDYPYEARRQRITGSGVATLSIDVRSGEVIDVSLAQSTGSAVLDNATISGFRCWRFKPGTPATVQSPITYALSGVSY